MTGPQTKRYTPLSVQIHASPVLRALRAASRSAAEKLVEDGVEGAEQLGDELLILAETVYGMATDTLESSIEPTTVVFSRALVDALRTEFIARLNKDRSRRIMSKEMLAVFAAMEELTGISERADSATEFKQRLESPDAGRAVAEIAHDMRSPLSAILFLVETLRAGQSGPVTPVQERQLGLVYGAALGLSGLADDIMEATRGSLIADAKPQPFSLSEIIHEVTAIVAPVAEEKGLSLSETYPTVDTRLGHSAAIHRVLLNLTNNALKYTQSGAVSLGCADLDSNRVEFWVEDTGRGIPEHVMAMLFTEFRPGASGMRFSSAGLGLAICRSLLAKMNSSLRVDTAQDQGTRFSFVLELPPA
ncbi:MAG TPA: HAMP domain-containing sensor histidine kinase [Gemmatimonadaceae bacterium]|nr:HAMP domain-containing sensor histidine kinase [Gemmatimonadaceae bacterium]